jgi:STAM-binding protein
MRCVPPSSQASSQRIVLTFSSQAQVSLREERFADAYMFFMRYSMLVLEHMRAHPEAKTPEARKAMKTLRERMLHILDDLETLRSRLGRSYDEWARITAAERERDQERDSSRSRQRSGSSAQSRPAPKDSLSWGHSTQTTFLDANENQELAVDLYKKEMHRRRRMAGLSAEEVSRRRAAGVWNNAVQSFQNMDDAELRRQMEDTRRQLDHVGEGRGDSYEPTPEPQPVHYHYPSIGKSSPYQYETPRPPPSRNDARIQPVRPPKEAFERPRPVPPKEALDRSWPVPPPLVPARPEKRAPSYERPPEYSSLDNGVPPLPPKHAEGTVKQKRITFSAAARLENGKPLRSVFFPGSLRRKFLELAAGHLRENVEMCGLLCGTIVNNALFITCLVIPEQKGTSDTCEVENEAALVEFYVAEELITIGWIHTHPSQSCFMSSHDLHTHAGYQVSIPESFAIVCAPRHEPS